MTTPGTRTAARTAGEGSQQEPSRGGRVPTVVVVLAAVVLCVNVVMMFAGAWAIGVTADEPTHLMRLQNLLDHGWYAESGELTDGVLTSSSNKVFVYAPVVAWLGHAAAVVAGIEEPGRVIAPVADYANIVATPDQYAIRHVVVAALAVLGMAAVAAITRVITGSWRWGLLSAAGLSAVPMWTGHAMFNPKDIPVAVGYTLVTLGCVLFARRGVLASGPRMWRAAGALVAGVVLGLGTRPGIWPALAGGVLVLLLGTRIADGRQLRPTAANRDLGRRVAIVAGSGAVALVILAVAYPKVFLNPVGVVVHSVGVSSQFDEWNGWTLTAGVAHLQPPPLWYLPAWFGHQIPVLLLAAGVAGLLLAAYLVVRVLIRREVDAHLVTGLAVVATQVVLAPALAVAAGSHIYSGVRQLLFVVPGLVVLAAVAGWWLMGRLRRFGRRGMVAASSAVLLALVLPTVDQARLFPYAFTYFNEVATLRPVDGRWATDYWQASYRELARSIGPEGAIACPNRYGIDQAGLAAERFAKPDPPGCTRPTVRLFLSGQPREAGPADEPFWFLQMNFLGPHLPANCQPVATVTRPLRWQQVTMSYLARCQPLADAA